MRSGNLEGGGRLTDSQDKSVAGRLWSQLDVSAHAHELAGFKVAKEGLL